MKKKQINKQKVEVFEEKELKEKMNLSKEQIDSILNYQEKFPELLQKKIGFCIDARNLWEQLGSKRQFGNWMKERITKYKFVENVDFTRFNKNVKAQNTYVNTIEYYFTFDTAKELCLVQNNDSGRRVRQYFILMEDTLRNYEHWTITRESEKDGWNKMSDQIKEWCKRKGFDYSIRSFYTREANMLNKALLGYPAQMINEKLNNQDEVTRDHLNQEINNALYKLEELNISLLLSDLDFETRDVIINKNCENSYSDLKHILDSKVA
jgi:phage anti-repressor protein